MNINVSNFKLACKKIVSTYIALSSSPVPRNTCELIHCILPTTLHDMYYFYISHLTNEVTKAEKGQTIYPRSCS